MPVTTAANAAITEVQFEAQLRAATLAAFPWLPANGLIHQKSFTFRFGKATVTVNGDAKSYALARADVLVIFQGEPLAIFELKRPRPEADGRRRAAGSLLRAPAAGRGRRSW